MSSTFLDELQRVLAGRRIAIAPDDVVRDYSPWDPVAVRQFVRRCRVHIALLHRATPEAQAQLAASQAQGAPATPAAPGVATDSASTGTTGWAWGWKLLGY